ncbi:hypothetical protein C8J56DRAFT_1031021 [Mycena floridula]|nr:hypothetical protein C8J56DRAFT_1031021 [Mycena floridula]
MSRKLVFSIFPHVTQTLFELSTALAAQLGPGIGFLKCCLNKQFRRLFPAIASFFYGAWLLLTCLVLLGFDWDSPAAPATAAPPVVSSSSGALVPLYNEQSPTVPGAVKCEPAVGPVLVPSSKLPQLVEPLVRSILKPQTWLSSAQRSSVPEKVPWKGYPDRNLEFNFNKDEMNQTGRLMTHWACSNYGSHTGSPGADTWQKGQCTTRICLGIMFCDNDDCMIKKRQKNLEEY